jgi:uncharacterized protein YigE (DUF2233 family)
MPIRKPSYPDIVKTRPFVDRTVGKKYRIVCGFPNFFCRPNHLEITGTKAGVGEWDDYNLQTQQMALACRLLKGKNP